MRDEQGAPVAGALVRTGIKLDDERPEEQATIPVEFAASAASMFQGVYMPNPYVSVAATDAQGAFEISAPATDQTTLGVVASFGARVSNVVDVARDETTVIELRLNGTATAQLAGRVLQPDGTPADGAQVSASYARTEPIALRSMLAVMGPPTTITNAEGEFTIGGLLPGEYVVTAIDPAFTSERKPNANMKLKTGTSNAVLTLPQAGGVRVVVRGPDGQPISTTWVCAHTPADAPGTRSPPPKLANTCGTNREGSILLAGVPVGRHTFEVSSRFSKPATFSATIRHGETTDAGTITLLPK